MTPQWQQRPVKPGGESKTSAATLGAMLGGAFGLVVLLVTLAVLAKLCM